MRIKINIIRTANKSFKNVQNLGIILLMMQANCRINIPIICYCFFQTFYFWRKNFKMLFLSIWHIEFQRFKYLKPQCVIWYLTVSKEHREHNMKVNTPVFCDAPLQNLVENYQHFKETCWPPSTKTNSINVLLSSTAPHSPPNSSLTGWRIFKPWLSN
jgi:hypothetical protein